MNADQAIERSINHNEIVTITPDTYVSGTIRKLAQACDDSVETLDRVEFWGTDDSGSEWRVHVIGSAE